MLRGQPCVSQTIDYLDKRKKEEDEEKRRKDEEKRKTAEASKFDNLNPEKQRELKEKARSGRFSSTGHSSARWSDADDCGCATPCFLERQRMHM